MDAIACGNVGGALSGTTLATGLAKAGVPGHIGFALFRSEEDQTVVLVVLGHGLASISASGAVGENHVDKVDATHDDTEDGHAAATPEAQAVRDDTLRMPYPNGARYRADSCGWR